MSSKDQGAYKTIGEVVEILECKNIHDNPLTRYTIDPLQLLEAENYCDENNLKIIAIYHSHTHSQAFPSTTDINNAIQSMWTDPFYILISLIEKTRPIIRGYKIGSDDVEEIIVEHDGPSYISPT